MGASGVLFPGCSLKNVIRCDGMLPISPATSYILYCIVNTFFGKCQDMKALLESVSITICGMSMLS